MRLAQLEMKVALVRLLHSFTIVACSETKVGMEQKSNSEMYSTYLFEFIEKQKKNFPLH